MVRIFYDRDYIGGGEYIETCDPDYDPNKKNWLQRLIVFIKKLTKLL